jgi:hypothetical protein
MTFVALFSAATFAAGCSQSPSAGIQSVPNAVPVAHNTAKRKPRIASTTAFFVANAGVAGNPSLAVFEGSANTPIGLITNPANMTKPAAIAWDASYVYMSNAQSSGLAYVYDVLDGNNNYINGNEAPAAKLTTSLSTIAAMTINPTTDLGGVDNVVIAGTYPIAGQPFPVPAIEEYSNPNAGNHLEKRIYGGNFGFAPSGVAVSSNGDYFVSSQTPGAIERIAAKSSGSNPVIVGGALPNVPLDQIAIGTNDNTGVEYVVATVTPVSGPSDEEVYIWRSSSITTPAPSAPDYILKSSSFGYPTGIGIDVNSNIYVADTSKNKVFEFDSSGNVPAHGSAVSPTHTFSSPTLDAPTGLSMPSLAPL